jgi:hypothetical protein
MNPYKLREIYKYLTRAKKVQPDLPNVFSASKAPIPLKTQNVEEIEAINRFVRSERQQKAGGGNIGGGNIKGTSIGDRTGFANIFLEQGKKSRFGPGTDTIVIEGKEYRKISDKNNPNFGKYSFRESVSTGERYPSGRIKSKEKTTYYTEKQLRDRIAKGSLTGKALYKSYTPGYVAELKDIKKFVDDKGAKNIYLSDLVEKFGDVTKETTDDSIRDATTEKKIKRAIGDDTYKKLIKGGTRTKIIAQKKKTANELVRAIKRGDKPLISLSSDMTGEAPNTFKSYLGKTERNMYDSIIPKLKAIVSRVTQPRQIYQATDAIEELKKATTKTFNQIIKKYPQALAARNVLTSGKGIVAYNDRSYILSQLNRHVQNGGTKYKYVSGDTTATIKFRNTETGKMISLNNIDVKDPEFKEAADAYNQKQEIMNTEIDDPRKKGAKIKIGQAIAANGDSIVIDHLDDVKNNPLKNLAITNQKANMAATIKGATEAELKSIGRGLKLNTKDNIKRYSNYAKRVLVSPDSKRPGPKETIFTKEGTLRGSKTPPDIEIKKLIATLSKDPRCNRGFKSQGGRAGFQEGTPPSLDVCYQGGVRNINSGMKNVTPAQAKNFAAFANRAASFGRGVMKYGIVPEALYVAADSVIRMGMGDNLNEAFLRASEYITPGDQTKKAEMLEADRFFGPEVAGIIGKSIDYKNQLEKVQSLEDKKANLENLSGGGEFDYIGNLNQDVKNIDAQLKQATDDLNNKFKMTEPEFIYAKRMQDEVDDARSAGSFFTKLKSKFRDVEPDSDIETLGMTEQTQEDLNKKMLLQAPTIYKVEDGKIIQKNLSEATQTEIMDHIQLLRSVGVKESTRDLLDQQNVLRGMPISEQVLTYGPEAALGFSGTMGEPIKKPRMEKPQNVIGDMEKEIVGQTNAANRFDLDLSMIGSGFSQKKTVV